MCNWIILKIIFAFESLTIKLFFRSYLTKHLADLYRSCSKRWPLHSVSITLADQLISRLSLTTIGSLKIGLITNPRRLSRFNWKMSLHVTKHPFLDKNQSLNWTQEKKTSLKQNKKVKYLWKIKTNICIREKCK